ncbi:GNAT family N-acetyltransferase [Alkalihalophilus marmarensis]|uniref:GNAT family N-acetyltransferase n=1 Tax=Alkalihalophilus marmarensis TaxID=521377 RepID=UPI002DC034E9|nr:GNAT family N-acetyltransferase [Alkalihalophilus marmarensis]MEC2070721.1 GNAT family N-acetyltransferase [Alkalihalophilus marmarensis]
MLIPYKTSQKKIAMGLLSYMPKEKDVKKLIKTIELYETKETWKLFFWKVDDDIVGIAGLEMDGDEAILHHLSVNPSYREEGLGTNIIHALKERLNADLKPSKETKDFLLNCEEKTN